jgi:hypothetical protein
MKTKFAFTAELWIYPGMVGNWHFISLPKKDADAIKKAFGTVKTRLPAGRQGWGSLRVEARIRKSVWKTSIFPDKKSGTYLLPVKAEVRKREAIVAKDNVPVEIKIIQ